VINSRYLFLAQTKNNALQMECIANKKLT
jgi:hypothetical protein